MIRTEGDLDDRLAAMRREFDEAFALPVEDSRLPMIQVLRITLAGQPYAIRVGDLGGIEVDRKVVPVPSALPGVLGVCAVRGRLVAVHDLAVLLGLDARARGRRCIALNRDVEAIGLAFDGLDGAANVPARDVESIEGSDEEASSREVLRIGADRVPVIDLASIARRLRQAMPTG